MLRVYRRLRCFVEQRHEHDAGQDLSSLPTRRDRALAAASHLGFPLWSVVLPLAFWAASPPESFIRGHARQAFSLQCIVLLAWATAMVFVAFQNDFRPALAVAASALLTELVQIIRAIAGRRPFALLPALLSS